MARWLMIPLAALVGVCGANALDAAELLRNGGFEEAHSARGKRPAGWTFAVWSSKPSTGALEWSTEGLRMMESDPARLWAEHRHFTHSRILRTLGREAEADEHLKHAYEHVMLVAGNTQDQELRRSWLENVKVNREILVACAQRGIGPE